VDAQQADLSRVAATYADTIIQTVQQEYPNALRHTMTGPDDLPTPQQVHPAFYGCFDWHSCVEMHWALVRLLRLVPDAIDHAQTRATLARHVTTPHLQQEAAYLQAHPGFERPYGWGWALMLANEVADWQDADAQIWAAAMRPLAQTITDLLLAWLPRATYPNREGVHANSAFGLARSLPWARRLAHEGDPRLLQAITATALRWYQQDREYPAAWEPSGSDFLSPALTEAELMGALMDAGPFLAWFDAFLPELAQTRPPSLFQPAIVSDISDGQIAHLHGLNLYRAYAMQRLSQLLPADDVRGAILRQAAATHAAASLPAVTGTNYMAEHWLACYAVLYLGETT
jgi:hypothetical protein